MCVCVFLCPTLQDPKVGIMHMVSCVCVRLCVTLQDPKIAIMHMACAVGGEEEEGGDEPMQDATHTNTQAVDAVPEVTFLYKLTPGG